MHNLDQQEVWLLTWKKLTQPAEKQMHDQEIKRVWQAIGKLGARVEEMHPKLQINNSNVVDKLHEWLNGRIECLSGPYDSLTQIECMEFVAYVTVRNKLLSLIEKESAG